MNTNTLSQFRYRIFPTLFIVFLLSSCRVTFLPSYDAGIVQQIETISIDIDRLYLQMLEKDKAGERTYSEYVDGYINIEVEMNLLLTKNKARPYNKDMVTNSQILLDQWIKWMDEHKQRNDLSDLEIQYRRTYFNDMIFAIISAEKFIPPAQN